MWFDEEHAVRASEAVSQKYAVRKCCNAFATDARTYARNGYDLQARTFRFQRRTYLYCTKPSSTEVPPLVLH